MNTDSPEDWANWARARLREYKNGQLELRFNPVGLVRGPIVNIEAFYDNRIDRPKQISLVITTGWTAVQPAEFPGGLGGPVPTGPWQLATPTRQSPKPNEFILYPGPRGDWLHWERTHNGVTGMHYHDHSVQPPRPMFVTFYPNGHQTNINKPA